MSEALRRMIHREEAKTAKRGSTIIYVCCYSHFLRLSFAVLALFAVRNGIDVLFAVRKGIDALFAVRKGIDALFAVRKGIATLFAVRKGIDALFAVRRGIDALFAVRNGLLRDPLPALERYALQ
jgi:hypothetical protein